jgi:predicted ester cyclase
MAGLSPAGEGHPPTGRHVMFSATDIYPLSGGQDVEEWNTLEQLALLESIGAPPNPEGIS